MKSSRTPRLRRLSTEDSPRCNGEVRVDPDTRLMADVELAPERRIHLQGARNCRELGGYLTQSGEMVRWRRVLRSGSLDGLSDADAAALVAAVGATPFAIDLRTPIDRPSACPFPGVAVPLLEEHAGPDPMFVPGVALEHVYCAMLRKAAPRIVAVLTILAESAHPAVVHCGLGRDRTGLLAAVLLGVLGVGDEDISRDYALSAPDAGDASAQTMRAVLRSVRADHGSLVGFAFDGGADVDLIEALRARLLW